MEENEKNKITHFFKTTFSDCDGRGSSKRIGAFILLIFGIVFAFLDKNFEIVSLFILTSVGLLGGGSFLEKLNFRSTRIKNER